MIAIVFTKITNTTNGNKDAILVVVAAYNESRRLCLVDLAVILLVLIYWLILSIFSLVNQLTYVRRVCIKHRCVANITSGWLVCGNRCHHNWRHFTNWFCFGRTIEIPDYTDAPTHNERVHLRSQGFQLCVRQYNEFVKYLQWWRRPFQAKWRTVRHRWWPKNSVHQ